MSTQGATVSAVNAIQPPSQGAAVAATVSVALGPGAGIMVSALSRPAVDAGATLASTVRVAVSSGGDVAVQSYELVQAGGSVAATFKTGTRGKRCVLAQGTQTKRCIT